MCGIAGFRSGADEADVAARLLACLGHRGPDGEAWSAPAHWVLAHTRLAVIDLSDRVRYPLGNETGDVWVTFNGEIYNFRELQRELQALGHRFATGCDAEVLVHGWEEWRLGLFARLSGMFALGLVDERTGELVVARDRLGIKPLCATTGDRFAFASDAMTLVEAGLAAPVVDRDALDEFLAFHYVPPPRTGIAGVHHVDPGTAVVCGADGRRQVHRWAPATFDATQPAPEAPVSLEELDAVFDRAVERHLVSDVEVGLLLSSGVDSSLILERLASRGEPPVCFTIGFGGAGDYDEAGGAEQLARRYGAEHHVDRLDVGFVAAVESVASAFDGPFADASAVPTLAVARLASQRVKVVLSGTGGDDLFAGYYRHRAHLLHRFVRAVPAPALKALTARRALRGGERTSTLSLFASYATRLAQIKAPDTREQYLALVGTSTSDRALELMLHAVDLEAARGAAGDRLALPPASAGHPLRGIQAFECRSYLPYDLLVKEDRATMAHSLESRVPLLDAELVSLAERMPPKQLISLRAGKRPLRELADARIGSASTVKRGFATPLGPLLRGAWRAEAREWLHASGSTLVDGPAAARALQSDALNPSDVWALATLIAWERRLSAVGRAPAAAAPVNG